jgi:TolA-binding protein
MIRKLIRWCGPAAVVCALSVAGANRALSQDKADPPAPSKPAASSIAAREQYAVAVNLFNTKQWALAADELADFLKNYSQDPLAPKARHYLGVCRVQLKQYDQAIAALSAVLKENRNFELADESLFHLGLAHFQSASGASDEKKDARAAHLKKAAAALKAVIDEHAKSRLVPESMYYLAETQYLSGDKKTAVLTYKRLIDEHAKHRLVPDALYGLGFAYEETGEHALAEKVYDDFLAAYPRHDLAIEVTLRKGESLLARKQYAQAEPLFAKAAAAEGFAQADHALFQQATCAFEQKQYERAAELYLSIPKNFARSPEAPLARLNAGKALYQRKNFAAMRDALAPLVDTGAAKGDIAAEATHLLARSLIEQKKPADALAAIEKALADASGNRWEPNLLFDQADATYEIPQRRKDAIALYASIARRFPQFNLAGDALYLAAHAALQVGDAARAIELADEFAKSFPEHKLAPDVQYTSAEARLLTERFADAEKIYRQLLAEHADHRDNALWKRRLGYALYLQGRWDDAIAQLQPLVKAIKEPAALADVYHQLGTAQQRLGRHDAAIENLDAAVSAHPTAPNIARTRLALAESFAAQKRFDEAIAQARAATSVGTLSADQTGAAQLAQTPPEVLAEAHFRLASYLAQNNHRGDAVKTYQVVLNRWSTSPFAPYALQGIGLAHLADKNLAQAEKAFAAVLEKHPDHKLAQEIRFDRGQARQLAGDYAAALEDITAYLKATPSPERRSPALHILGICQDRTKEHEKAVRTFRRLLADDRKYPEAAGVLYELGWTLKTLKQDRESLAAFEQLAKEHPNSSFAAEAHYLLGEAHYAAKEYNKAAASYQRAAEANQRAAGLTPAAVETGEKILHKLGWTHYRLAAHAAAQNAFRQQLSDHPRGNLAPDAQFMLGECLFAEQKYADALPAYEKALAVKLSSREMRELALLHAGQSASQLKRWNESIELLEKMLAAAPQSYYAPDALYEQGWAKKNQADNAQERPADSKPRAAGSDPRAAGLTPAVLLDEAAALFDKAAILALEVKGQDQEIGAKARFMCGEIHFLKRDHKTALRHFYRVAKGYGYPDKTPAAVKKWQAKAFYEIGRVCEVLKLVDQARKEYQEVLDRYAESEEASAAKKRLAELTGG